MATSFDESNRSPSVRFCRGTVTLVFAMCVLVSFCMVRYMHVDAPHVLSSDRDPFTYRLWPECGGSVEYSLRVLENLTLPVDAVTNKPLPTDLIYGCEYTWRPDTKFNPPTYGACDMKQPVVVGLGLAWIIIMSVIFLIQLALWLCVRGDDHGIFVDTERMLGIHAGPGMHGFWMAICLVVYIILAYMFKFNTPPMDLCAPVMPPGIDPFGTWQSQEGACHVTMSNVLYGAYRVLKTAEDLDWAEWQVRACDNLWIDRTAPYPVLRLPYTLSDAVADRLEHQETVNCICLFVATVCLALLMASYACCTNACLARCRRVQAALHDNDDQPLTHQQQHSLNAPLMA